MKRRLALLLALGALRASLLLAADGRDEELLRALAVNRTLLERFESEFSLLEGASPSPVVVGELENLKTKIRALKEESMRLQADLTPEEQARDFLEEVVRASEGDRKTKLKRSEAAATRAGTLHERGLRLVAERRLDEAASVYEEITLLDPDDDQAFLILGHVRLLGGRYEKAAEAFGNAMHIDPENVGEIVPFYDNLVLQSPDDDQARANLGYAHLFTGDVLKARECFKEALDQNPENPSAANGLSVIDEG